jgi:hypothetical protein
MDGVHVTLTLDLYITLHSLGWLVGEVNELNTTLHGSLVLVLMSVQRLR